jgi:hypothetical protein
MRMLTLVAALSLLLFADGSQAYLIDRGGGLIYDTVLNITWLQDANLSAKESFGVSGISSDGRMNRYEANEWIAAMNAADYLGYDNWRLPQTLPVNGLNYNYGISYTGATDRGYNISAPGSAFPGSKGSEMAYMFYGNLGNKAYSDVNGNNPQPGWGLQNKSYFGNLQDDADYWSGTVYAEDPAQLYSAWTFIFSFGNQGSGDKMGNNFFVWAVRDGDVAPVPLPSTIWLFGSGLAGIMGYIKLKGNRRA